MRQSSSAADSVSRNIARASWLLMGSIFVSRLIGFFREWVLARTVGATAMTDVYYASFTIPDLLNYLMAAGAMSISFIPQLSQFIAEGREDFAKQVFRALSTLMGAVLLGMILLCEIFARPLAVAIAPGFSDPQLDTLALLLRVILPAQLFFYWGSLAISVQHTHGRFLIPAIAPIVYNSGIILLGVLLHQSHGVMGFSLGVLAGAFVSHGLLQWWGAHSLGYTLKPVFHFPPEIRDALTRYMRLTLPIMLGFSIVVTDEWFSKYFASELQARAVSWLSYARTEMRIPVAILGQAAGVASFPYVTRLWAKREYEGYARVLTREAMKLWAAGPLAAILLWTHAEPITAFIYGGGKFMPEDVRQTAETLRMFAPGVFFWTIQVLLARGFYACQRTWLPPLLGGLTSLVTVPVYWWLAKEQGHAGLALAGSIAVAIYCFALAIALHRHMRVYASQFDFRPAWKFVGLWSVVLAGLGVLAFQLPKLGIYQATRMTAFADVMLAAVVLAGIAILLLRTVFRKLTDGPLF